MYLFSFFTKKEELAALTDLFEQVGVNEAPKKDQ